MFERLAEHTYDALSNKELSHISQYLSAQHPEHPKPDDPQGVADLFEVKIVKKHKSAMTRQLHEALTITKSTGIVLNQKDEYSRCIIPEMEMRGWRKPVINSNKW